jgi:FtsP/CotA-like multicopper oxidase with cupredoxin domain
MHKTRLHRIMRLLTLLTTTAVATAALAGSASAAAVSIDLCATTGSAVLPGPSAPVTVTLWGFAPGTCLATGNATAPGPALTVDEGDVVTVNVKNDLNRTISFEIPGVTFDAGPSDAAPRGNPGDTVSRTFTASRPGTFLYQSVGDAERQTAMGMYGALIVRSATAGQAYDTAGAYDNQATLVLSAMDPAFNNAADPSGFDMRDYHPTQWLINGTPLDPGNPHLNDITHPDGPRVLLRYVNAGFDNTTMLLVGAHERVLARDAHLVANAFDADAETIPAGATEDVIVTVPAASTALPNGFPLFNRQLHLGNGTMLGGGQMTFIQP